MLDQKRVGEFIAKLRKGRGLTQSALAELLCVTHQAVSKWENGAALPDLEVLMAMRQTFGLSIDDILDCRMPPQEPADPPSSDNSQELEGEASGKDTVTDDTIIILTSRSFNESVSVDECKILGQAEFKADLQADTVVVMGRGKFAGSVTADSLGVSGSADIGRGVQADEVHVSGRLNAAGGITCDSMGNSGMTNCGGGIMCDDVKNSGSFTMGGGVTADSLLNSGTMTLGGGLTCDSMENIGIATLGGGVTSDSFTSRGELTLGGGMMADKADLSGRFCVGGGITADSVSITLSEQDCAAAAITADSLIVRKHSYHDTAILTCRQISAADVDLVNIHADRVRARSGRMGEGCRIAKLECSEDVEVLPGAEVRERMRA